MKVARELASIAFGRSRKGFLLPLRGYFDGSGKNDNQPVITVGGFLADSDLCEAIEDAWEIATGGKVFHLAEFGRRSCKLGSADWNTAKQVEFLKLLAAIVNRQESYIISASVEVAQYDSFIHSTPYAHVFGPAFSGCAWACITLAEAIIEWEGRHEQKVSYIFEKGDRQHELAKMIREWEKSSESDRSQLRGLAFEPKTTTLLQCADLVAGIVQRCTMRAHTSLGFLDNGLSHTPLDTFMRYYSTDGVTESVVNGHDHYHCWVINNKTFEALNRSTTTFFDARPEALKTRLKQAPFHPK